MLSQYSLFDSYLHIIDKRLPRTPNNGYLPDAFSHQQYLARMLSYKLCDGVVVSDSFRDFDQTCLEESVKNIGDSFVGVTQFSASDNEILK